MAEQPTLYAAKGGGSAIIEALFALAGVDCKVRYFSWEELPDDELLAVNPLGEIPALRLPGGEVLTETAAITLWLGDGFPDSGLVPSAGDPRRNQFLRHLIWLVAAVYPTFTYSDHPERFVADREGAQSLYDSTERRRQQLWRQLEAELEGPWLCGGAMTALDVFIAVMSSWRPQRDWFARECPTLFTIARQVDRLQPLQPVWRDNGLPQS
ncbi:glutathione S-transferase family protein [Microbulbifer halophilus]|uniref:Glutathione S-transferase family protein n=1 Tax=Microbulbifer halophilus TaxID=453963 RepID=A0ABW5ECC8_9GAMM|nr:glutathione S-transferase family protein [Microbulbifer halophilus]MCW8125356.1 glutathione S-transferase family protein [Microbulbifer halophilus]